MTIAKGDNNDYRQPTMMITMMATARRVLKSMMMATQQATVQRDTTTITMATGNDNDGAMTTATMTMAAV